MNPILIRKRVIGEKKEKAHISKLGKVTGKGGMLSNCTSES